MISVIVPIYKVEDYLPKCIDSILNQTYKDLEIILVDDGSPDNCGKICDEYAKQDKRIRVIHKENGGLSSARNAGIEAAKGDYIGFVDSDDYISMDMYEKMVVSIETENADVSVCCFKYVNEDGSAFETSVKPFEKYEVLSKEQAIDKITTLDRYYTHFATAVNKLYRRAVIEDLKFEEGRVHEDEFIAHLVYFNCSKIVIMPDELYYYVQRSGSIMNSSYSPKRLDAVRAYYKRYEFLKEKGYKKHAKNALMISYGFFLQGINRLTYRKNKNDLIPLLKKMMFNPHLGIRCIKLLLVHIRKKFREYVSLHKFEHSTKKAFKRSRKKDGKVVVIIATPIHGNLGDQAIVYAEKQLLESVGYSKDQIIEIKNDSYLEFNDLLVSYIKPNDLIVIDGGGNLGTLWQNEDDKIGQIITEYNSNKVVVFPQTIYYGNDVSSKNRLDKNKKIYDSCKRLIVALRDEKSYDFVKSNFPTLESIYCPDVVMAISDLKYVEKREGVILCFRDDLEKMVSNESIDNLKKYLTSENLPFNNTSTIVPGYVSCENREERLNCKWKEFASAKLVLTDRLHAMIFSAITATPCIAIDNVSKKVSGVYEWLKGLPYIKCVDSLEQAQPLIKELYKMDKCVYEVSDEFEELKKGLL